MALLPDTMVKAIEAVVERWVRNNVQLPLTGIVSNYSRVLHTVDVKLDFDHGYRGSDVNHDNRIHNIPIMGMARKYNLAARTGNFKADSVTVIPRIGSACLVGFVDGKIDWPYLMWAHSWGTTIISSKSATHIHSKGQVHIDAKAGVYINGKRVPKNWKP